MPNTLVDTDAASNYDYRTAKEYCLPAVELGVPDIYKIFDPFDTKEYGFTDQEGLFDIKTLPHLARLLKYAVIAFSQDTV